MQHTVTYKCHELTLFINGMVHVNNQLQYIPRNMHTVFALLCFVVVIHWLIFPYPSGLLHWHCGNLTIAPVPAKQPWWIWINTSCEFIMNDCITTTKQSTTKPCAYFLGYTVCYIIQTAWWGLRSMGLLLDTYRCLTCTLYCVLFLLHWHVWLISLFRPYLAMGNVINNFFLCKPYHVVR